jgi:hypothetical protein
MILPVAGCLFAERSWADEESRLRDFLMRFDVDASDIQRLADGHTVTTVVKSDNDREILIMGAIRVGVSKNFFLERCRDLSGLRGKEGVLQISKCSAQPTRADFSELRFPEDDLKDLKKCKDGDCNVKIDEAGLRRVRGAAVEDGSHSDINDIMQDVLFERARAYVEGGFEALPVYADKREPQSVAEAAESILGTSPHLYKYINSLHKYMSDYPNSDLDGAEDFIYWSLEDFGMKPTVELNHVVILDAPGGKTTDAAIGEISFYASHYFTAAMSLVFWVEDDLEGKGTAPYVLVSQRQWFDGDVKGLKRKQLNSRLKKSLEDTLQRQRDRLNAAYKQ